MMRLRTLGVVAVHGIFAMATCHAYELNTHMALSELAANRWVETDQSALGRVGLRWDLRDARQRFPNSKGELRTIVDLIRDGAQFEDGSSRLSTRPGNHFFNPTDGSGLHFPGTTYAASPDWALEDARIFSPQDNSYRDAREYFWRGLTLRDENERARNFGASFQSLGQIIHHVQDMAQPQHVRNDVHCDSWFCVVTPGYSPSVYEKLTDTASEIAAMDPKAYPVVYSATDTHSFLTPRQFWANGGKGIAEYTNRGFFSAGTLDGTIPSPPRGFPRWNPTPTDIKQLLPGTSLTGSVYFFPTDVRDDYRDGIVEIDQRSITESIFDADLEKSNPGQPPIYSLNRFNYASARGFLIPRAIGYSAGLLNYFFRGQLKIGLPDEGVYAVADTAPIGCGTPCGFRRVKLKLQNTTPGEGAMGPGKVVAVAKYRRNWCYTPELSGNYGGPKFEGNRCRSEEYLSVSSPNTGQTVGRADPAATYMFDFANDPIPLDATDLVLQVVYRGKLGQEDDAIAVTTADISEPNFIAMNNVTDYVFDNLGDKRYHRTSSKIPITSLTLAFADPTATPLPLASLDSLNGGEHAQIAILTERTNVRYWLRTVSSAVFDPDLAVPFQVKEFVLDESGGTPQYLSNCPVFLERGIYRQFTRSFAQLAHGVVSTTAKSVLPESADAGSTEGQPSALAKLATLDCYGPPAPRTGGLYDFSEMTPLFTPQSALAWRINF